MAAAALLENSDCLAGDSHFRLRHLCAGSAHTARASPCHPRHLGCALGRGADRAPRRDADRSYPGFCHAGALAGARNPRRPLLLCPEWTAEAGVMGFGLSAAGCWLLAFLQLTTHV